MKLTLPACTLLLSLAFLTSVTAAETPKGLSAGDWSSIRAAYDAGQHQFHRQEDGTQVARNPGLGWTMTFDEKGFTATDGNWTWGLELEASVAGLSEAGGAALRFPARALGGELSHTSGLTEASYNAGHTLAIPRTPQLTEWFINDQRGLEQGWTLTAPAEIRLRVRGDLKASVSAQSISFGGQLNYSGLKAWDATGKTVSTHFEATAEGFAVRYDDTGAQYPITIDPLAQNAYLKASNTGADDWFGVSVAVSGDTVVVGALFEDSSSTGVNSTPNELASESGAAYVFVRSGSTWSQQAYLKASNTGAGDQFGYSVAVSGDTAVVGAYLEASSSTGVNSTPNESASESGASYVFVRSGSTWSQQAYLKASNTGVGDNFGISVAVFGDTVAVGARFEDSSSTGVNFAPNELASNSGAAYVFVRSGSTWRQQAYLKASNTGADDWFGYSVAVSGDTVVVGALSEDSSSTGVNFAPNELASESGAAYVFVRSGSIWSQQAYLKASNTGADDWFGYSVAVSGDTVVVGALSEDSSSMGVNSTPNELADGSGAAYVFVRSGSIWSQQAYLKASKTGTEDQFGNSVAVSGDTVVVGAYAEDSSSTGVNSTPNELASESGAAYVFVRSGSTWSQQAYLKARNTGASDAFGSSVAVSGDTVVVGAQFEDSSSTGVNSAPDELASGSGAAYVFGIGELLESLGKTGCSTVGTDLAYGAPGFGAISVAGEVLFESSLLGTGSTGGRNMAMFSTVAGPVDIALQTGSIVSGLAGLTTGAKIATVTHAVHNRSASTGLFQATVTGTGIDATNNRLLFLDNGAFISPLLRSGQPIAELGGAVTTGFTDVLQDEAVSDRIALSYTLKARTGTAPVTTANDSGLLLMSHSGAIDLFNLREGADAFGRGGVFGQFGRAAMLNGESLRVIAKFIPTRGTPVDALFSTGLVSGFNLPKQGELAGGAGGARYGVFTGVTRWSDQGVVRATLTGSPTTSNEGVWTENDSLLLRKGQSIGGGLNIARILRIWGVNGFQLLAQVEVSGTGVNVTNNQALILRQLDENFLILLRTGDAAPGIGLSRVKVAALQAIDVDPINGHYAILGSLTGAATTANQALWSGQTRLGDDTTNQFQRLPKLRLQKGERYRTEVTNGDLIRSLLLKPAVDASGVGGRGLAQVVSANGQILLTITGDRAVLETVRLSP
jgi:hypothetical protein